MATSIIKRSVPSINGVQLYGAKTSQDLKIGKATTIGGTVSLNKIITASTVDMSTITLTTGTWIVAGALRFPYVNTTGKRAVIIDVSGSDNNSYCYESNTAAMNSSTTCYVSLIRAVIVSGTSATVTLRGYQNSGSDCTPIAGFLRAYKI